jgi:hypothetical protein
VHVRVVSRLSSWLVTIPYKSAIIQSGRKGFRESEQCRSHSTFSFSKNVRRGFDKLQSGLSQNHQAIEVEKMLSCYRCMRSPAHHRVSNGKYSLNPNDHKTVLRNRVHELLVLDNNGIQSESRANEGCGRDERSCQHFASNLVVCGTAEFV